MLIRRYRKVYRFGYEVFLARVCTYWLNRFKLAESRIISHFAPCHCNPTNFVNNDVLKPA
jgi:hypothetical protein